MKRKKDGIIVKENALKIVGSHLTTENRNKFLNACFKIRDFCSRGRPCLKNDSKSLNQLVDNFEHLFSLFRATLQRQTLFDAVVDGFSTDLATYRSEIVPLTVCSAILIQFPRRDLQWSDLEMTTLMKSVDRLRHKVLQSLNNLFTLQELTADQRSVIQWCHGVILYVIRMSVLFCLAKGMPCHEDVWHLPDALDNGNGESLHGDCLYILLKQQKRLYKTLSHKSSNSKVTLCSRPLLEVLKSLGLEKTESDSPIRKKRRCLFDVDNSCFFEIDSEIGDATSGTSKRLSLSKETQIVTDDLLSIMHSIESKATLLSKMEDEEKLYDFLNCLNLLKERQQSLSSAIQSQLLERVVWVCQSSSMILASVIIPKSSKRKAEMHQNLLEIWTFLMQRKRILKLLPNSHIYLTCLLTPDYSSHGFEQFVSVSSSVVTFMLRYITLFRAKVLSAPFLFLEAARLIWAEILHRAQVSTNGSIATGDSSRLCAVGLALTTFVTRLCEGDNRLEVSRLVRLLLEEHFLCCQSVTPHPEVKRCLQQTVFILLEVVDPFVLEQMKLDFKLGPRELLKRTLQDFRAQSKKEKSKVS